METLTRPEHLDPAVAPPLAISHCPVAIMRENDAEILVSESEEQIHLPEVDLPLRKRAAPFLQSAIYAALGLNTICRYRVELAESDPGRCCFVLDLVSTDQCLLQTWGWLPLRDICWDKLDPELRTLLWRVFARSNSYRSGKRAGRFVLPGWLQEVQEWTEAALACHGLELTGPVRQFNMGPDFTLLRFETTGQPVWFKAVGHPNLHEFEITRTLRDLYLPHVAELIAVHEPWHAWLMYEAPGELCDESGSSEQWKAVARSIAELQVASLPGTAALAQAGCRELTVFRLEHSIEPYLRQTALLMRLQPAESPRRLAGDDLRLIEEQLHSACRRMQKLEIPDSIGHSDFNRGNIVVSAGGAVFLDWAQGHIGAPSLTFEYLQLLVRRSHARDRTVLNEVRQEYLSAWRPVLPSVDLAESLSLAPLLAVFAYALVCHDPNAETRNLRAENAAYLRSLARTVHREAMALVHASSRAQYRLLSKTASGPA